MSTVPQAAALAEQQASAGGSGTSHYPQHHFTIEFQGATYSVKWGSYGGLSRTMKLYATVTEHSSAQSLDFPQIIVSHGKKGPRYNLKGHPAWLGRQAASQGLVELAVQRFNTLRVRGES